MPTKKRIQSASSFQHITARGNDRQDIFLDAKDRAFYLDLLVEAIKKFDFEVIAYCLMSNHVHLLARFLGLNMHKAMHFIQMRYAKYFNRKYGRSGHAFEKRYQNEVVATSDYLHEAGRYIHMNPVVEGIVTGPEDSAWSSFREYWDQDYRIVSKSSPLVTAFSPAGVFDREAFHAFTTARRRNAPNPAWYERNAEAPRPLRSDPLQEAADRNHPVVKKIIAGVCYGFGFWDDIYAPSQRCRARDSARCLALFLLKEALPAWSFQRLMPLAGLHYSKNAYRVYQKCVYRMAFDPGYRRVAADVRASLKTVKV